MPSIILNSELLGKGLRSTARKQREPTLVDCKGVRPSAQGLSECEPIIPAIRNPDLTALSIRAEWPHPQLFRGKGITLLCDRTAIYQVDEDFWTLTALNVYPPGSSTPTTITEGGAWHFADFTDCWLLTNGVHLLYKRPNDSRIRRVAFPCASICEHGGRLFVGGATTLWGSGWQTIVDAAINNAPAGFISLSTLANPTNYVWWSNVNALELFWFLLDTTNASAGELATHASSSPLWLELMERGDWGFAPMPHTGKVTTLAPLGNAVMAYGDNGVTKLVPVVEPVPTMSIQPVSSVGLFSRGAVAASRGRHVWLDASRAIWQAGPDSVNRLDYHEFAELFGSQVLGTHDPEQNVAYLSDGAYTLMLTETGMAQSLQCPTSLIHAYGDLRGIVVDAPESQQRLEVVVDVGDLGTRGLKTVSSILVSGTLPQLPNGERIRACVDYRNSPLEEWTRSTERELTDEGAALDIYVTAELFRIVVTGARYTGASIDNIEVLWEPYDTRFVARRGRRRAA